MGQVQTQRYCRTCGRRTLHARGAFGFGLGCFFSIITAGLFVPVWLLIKVCEALFQQWRCQACGRGRIV
jgi:ribosomal protein L37E